MVPENEEKNYWNGDGVDCLSVFVCVGHGGIYV